MHVAAASEPPESAWQAARRITPTMLPAVGAGVFTHLAISVPGVVARLLLAAGVGLGAYVACFAAILAAHAAGALRGGFWRGPGRDEVPSVRDVLLELAGYLLLMLVGVALLHFARHGA